MPKFVALCALFVSFSALANDLAPQEVISLTAKFKVTMMDCPEKIWANYDWSGLKVGLVYPSAGRSWIWDASANSLQRVSNDTLPSSALGSSYEFFEIDGQSAMSLNMEEKNEEIFQLGAHELFHYHGQKNWQSGEVRGGRGTEYPVSWQPRIYRRMIFENLKKYILSNESRDLEKARFWFEKWSTEYPNEPKYTTDGYEGTAEYVERLAYAVSELGCTASDAKLKAHVVNQIKSKYGFSVSGQYFGLDSEGYEIGSLAAFILRFQSGNLKAWNDGMALGQTPLQVLLESIRSEPESASQSLINQFQISGQKINRERGSILDNDIANWNNKTYVRLPTPHDWLQSNLMPKFFATATQISKDLFPLYTDHRFLSPTGTSDFTVKKHAVIFSHYPSVCSNQYSFTLVPATSVNFVGGIADVSARSVVGKISGQLKSDDQGFQYLCID